MESYVLPQLQKSTSVQYKMVQREASPLKLSKFKVGSLPSLPHHNAKGLLLRKHSCFDQYTPHQETPAQRTELYKKVLSLIEDMIGNPSKFQVLLSALSSMENSIKNVRKSKGSIDIKTTTGQKSMRQKFSQRSIEIQISRSKKMANSEGVDSVQKEREGGCGGEIIAEMAESIELECPYDGLTGVDKVSLDESEEMKASQLSGVRSIQEGMLESLHFPDLPDMYRRISLLLVDEEQEAVSELWSSGSSAPPQFPILPLGLPLVQAFFSEASALLVNLALSLLFKYLLRSGVTLRAANAGWLLGVSALVGYKIFYDETLQGILEYFGGVLTVGADEAARLQRWFLSELNYEVLINNKHYAEIMIKLMSQE